MSLRLNILNFTLRHFERRALSWINAPATIRWRMNLQTALFFRAPRKVPIMREALAHGQDSVPCLRISDGQKGVLLFLHGGAHIFGSAKTHSNFVAKIAVDSGLTAYSVDYRLAPEHPFPAAIDDAYTAYQALLTRGISPNTITLGGDSAGGGLALALLHRILAEGSPPPCNLIAFSPLTDQTLTSASLVENADTEVMLPAEHFTRVRDMYLKSDFKNPLASPLYGNFKAAPTVFLTVGTKEILRDDSLALAAKLRQQGVPVTIEIGENLPHVWPFFHGFLPEANRTLQQLKSFLNRPSL